MNIYLYNHNHHSPDGEQVQIGIDTGHFLMRLEKNTKDAYIHAQTFEGDQLRMSGTIPCEEGRMELVRLGADDMLLRIGEIGNQNVFMMNEFTEVEGEDAIADVVLVTVTDVGKASYFLSNIWGVPVKLPHGERVKLRRGDFSPADYQ